MLFKNLLQNIDAAVVKVRIVIAHDSSVIAAASDLAVNVCLNTITAVFDDLTLENWRSIVTIAVSVLSFTKDLFFKIREDQRQKRYWSERSKQKRDDKP